MAQLMNDEQRLRALEEYNPKDHLISVGKNKDGSAVLYYPAAWRLYELRLRHPHFTLEAEIVYMEEGTVVIKAIGYDGLDYASSSLKGTALKQGKLFELDKVETKAKSRVARDIGIGTEYALDMTPDETDGTHDEPEPVAQIRPASSGHAEPETSARIPTVKELQARCNVLYPGAGAWQTMVHKALKVSISDGPILDKDMTIEYRQKTAAYLDYVQEQKAVKAS